VSEPSSAHMSSHLKWLLVKSDAAKAYPGGGDNAAQRPYGGGGGGDVTCKRCRGDAFAESMHQQLILAVPVLSCRSWDGWQHDVCFCLFAAQSTGQQVIQHHLQPVCGNWYEDELICRA